MAYDSILGVSVVRIISATVSTPSIHADIFCTTKVEVMGSSPARNHKKTHTNLRLIRKESTDRLGDRAFGLHFCCADYIRYIHTYHHGDLFGFENLYLVASDTDPRCIQFLSQAAEILKINYFTTNGQFGQILAEMQTVANNLPYSGDFFTKLDTNEFFTYYNTTSKQIDHDHLFEYLDSVPFDGGRYNVLYTMGVMPNVNCSAESNPAIEFTHFYTAMTPFGPNANGKAFLSLSTVGTLDLGNHKSTVRAPYHLITKSFKFRN
jgi:hypothetical protein